MNNWISRFVVLCAFLLASASVYAHHSLAGVYALGKEAKVTGAFKAFRLVNPHSTMKIEVKGKDGKTVTRRNVAKFQEKMERLQENVSLHEKNIELLEKELSSLK